MTWWARELSHHPKSIVPGIRHTWYSTCNPVRIQACTKAAFSDRCLSVGPFPSDCCLPSLEDIRVRRSYEACWIAVMTITASVFVVFLRASIRKAASQTCKGNGCRHGHESDERACSTRCSTSPASKNAMIGIVYIRCNKQPGVR